MPAHHELYYYHVPRNERPVGHRVEFLPVQSFVADEPSCKALWDLLSTQFRTRGKFLAIWSGVRFVAVHRDTDGEADGFLLVNAPVNWQIDYVVVRTDRRGLGIAGALVGETLNEAFRRGVPFVSLTSREELRPFYEMCGFTPVENFPAALLAAGSAQA